jgi:hypothetical protein
METANNDQELESASVTLVDGLHFAGDIGGVRIDLDAEESVGGVGAGPQPHRLLPAFDGWLHRDGCPLDPAEKTPAGEWPQRGGPGEPDRATSEGLHALRSTLQGERRQHRSSSGSACH